MSEEKIGGKSETKRFLIMTVGKTHSGKSTFARELEVQLPGALIIDQDNHAEFVNTYYRKLLPKSGPNEIKYAISQTIVEYAVERTSYHLILCNSNRGIKERIKAISLMINNKQIKVPVSSYSPLEHNEDGTTAAETHDHISKNASSPPTETSPPRSTVSIDKGIKNHPKLSGTYFDEQKKEEVQIHLNGNRFFLPDQPGTYDVNIKTARANCEVTYRFISTIK